MTDSGIGTFQPIDWDTVADRLQRERCTPFLGAGVGAHLFKTGRELAEEWVEKFKLPLPATSPLDHVAQMISVKTDAMGPKDQMVRELRSAKVYDPNDAQDPFSRLSRFPVGIYITTNFDDYMEQALEAAGRKPRRILCPWNHELKDEVGTTPPVPTYQEPWVYHLHGHHSVPESMVLTEDDYIDFLLNMGGPEDLLHHRVSRAIGRSTLLFLGYDLKDPTFRVLFRGLVAAREVSIRHGHVTVQLRKPPTFTADQATDQTTISNYFRLHEDYFRRMNFRVYWGDVRAFLAELQSRLDTVLTD